MGSSGRNGQEQVSESKSSDQGVGHGRPSDCIVDDVEVVGLICPLIRVIYPGMG